MSYNVLDEKNLEDGKPVGPVQNRASSTTAREGGRTGMVEGNGVGGRSAARRDEVTVADLLKQKRGGIKQAPLPPGSPRWDDVPDLTLIEIERRAAANLPGYRTIPKLLRDKRFDR